MSNAANKALLRCKIVGLKFRKCKILDKYHVCIYTSLVSIEGVVNAYDGAISNIGIIILVIHCSLKPSLVPSMGNYVENPFVGFGHAQCPAGRVFQYRVRSGQVLDKIPGSGSGSGRVGVSKNTIRYFRVSFLLSGISGYFEYFWVCRVFSGISGFTHIY